MRFLFLPLYGVIFLLSACSSVGGSYSGYPGALELYQQGNKAGGRSLIESSCESGSQAACQVLGKNGDLNLPPGVAISQGPTGPDQTQLAISYRKGEKWQIALWEGKTGKYISPSDEDFFERDHSDFAVHHINFKGLRENTRYLLQVSTESGELKDYRYLHTLNIHPRKLRVAIASCMDDHYEIQEQMWKELIQGRPEVLFLIGDNVYADRSPEQKVTPPEQLWRRYGETREKLAIFYERNLIPTFATWDDHDYGVDNGNASYPHRKESWATFRAFFPQYPIPEVYSRGPGVSSHLSAFGYEFFLMDGRSFKGTSKQDSLWGEEQERWLESGLRRISRPLWVINGVQFFGAYHPFESYERDHPASFHWFKKLIRGLGVPTVLVSGDRHLTEIIKISKEELGFPTFELTSSGIHTKTFPKSFEDYPNPRMLVGKAGVYNYMMLDLQPGSPSMTFEATSFGEKRSVIFKERLTVRR